ncbi:ISL3 family transposase [Streptomyces sp. NPDC048277]|uniref:ISL3 family transposase n=1 Tax=Streptomyces sp. NPDC048277 TaxID=3155027 RepID=UPI003407B1EF
MTVEEVVVDDGVMTFSARTATRLAVCPGCGTVSGRVHGGYRRRLADVAVSGHRTVIDLLVRRFICPTQECDRRTFVEQVDGLTERFARRTASLHRTLEKIALALAGRPAARLAAHLSIPTSPNSLLRLLRKLPDEPVGTAPRVLGVDDFAFKKGHVYGTIILDMETGERVDVLPDRTAETLTAWLRAHPGAEIVCRDRASAYAEAVRTACPDATQVADRFHIWKNLCEAVEKCVLAHRACLTEPTEAPGSVAPNAEDSGTDLPVPAGLEGLRAVQRRERHAAVHALFGKGVGISAIAEALGLDRKTVRRYAHAAAPEDLPVGTGKRGNRVQPYLGFLHQRWNEGYTDAVRLCGEIRTLGYRGSERTVRRHLQTLRASGQTAPTVGQELTVRQATRLLTSHPDHLDENGTLQLKDLLARCPELDGVADCVRAFAEMMTERRGQDLADWLEQAKATGFPSLSSLARGLRQDFEAVTGIKRDGYGRAGFDLLRLQILHAD